MRTALKLAVGLLLAVNAVACGGSEALDEGGDALSSSSATLVAVRTDPRKSCTNLQCGGYYLRDVNKNGAETFVGKLDFAQANLDDATIAKVTGAPAGELVLSGKLGPVDARTQQRSFIVLEAWRGMPGFAPAKGDSFYEVTKTGTKTCVTAPCLSELAAKVNSAGTVPFSSYSVAAASTGFLDQTWLTARVRDHGALVAGRVVNGQMEPGGPDKVLDASQVYLRLPDGAGPCTKMVEQLHCASDEVETFVRDENRCMYPVACVKHGVCPMNMQPACADGYSLRSWPAGPSACAYSVCDPTFSL